MDALDALLDGPRASGAFVLRCQLDPPWSLRLEDEAPLTVTVVARGGAWIRAVGGEPRHLVEGDVLLTRGTRHWTVADDPATPAQVVIHPGQHCTTPDGRPLAAELAQGVRTWGNSATGEAVLLVGAYALDGEVGHDLLRALPDLVLLSETELGSPLPGLLAAEVGRDAPGQGAVLDRLLDLLLVQVLRAWLSRPDSRPPRWWSGQADPVVGPTLRLLQHSPEHPWTVASLASAAGVSRAAYARRFADVVGEPPMTFLTRWRLALAADLLLDDEATIAAVARRVGYGSPFALSSAFKRERGHSPREHRRRAALGAAWGQPDREREPAEP